MYAVYNIDEDIPVDLPDCPSLADLKGVCLAMHERRRMVLAALLSIGVEPFDPAWATWRSVVRELDGLTKILAEFTRELVRALDDEQRTIPPKARYLWVGFEIPPIRGRVLTHDHTRGLTSLSTTIKTLSAKMSLLKSELSSSLPAFPPETRHTVFQTYDSIGQDLHSLLSDWQTGRTDLLRLFPPDEPEEEEEAGSVADSGVGTSLPEFDPLNKRVSCGDWGIHVSRVTSPVPSDLPEIGEEGVIEGTARGRVQSGVLSRAERIERSRREREVEAERRRVAVERTRWVGELKDVLGRRGK